MFSPIRPLFKPPKYKRFNYQPRFYDADKEALQMRIKAIRGERGDGKGHDPDALRGRLSYAWRTNNNRKVSRRSNWNVVVIAGLLSIVAYYFFYA